MKNNSNRKTLQFPMSLKQILIGKKMTKNQRQSKITDIAKKRTLITGKLEKRMYRQEIQLA